VRPEGPRKGFEVKGKLAALIGGHAFPRSSLKWGTRGSGGRLHRDNHYGRGVVFEQSGSLAGLVTT
jgi:hypothetical protein